VDVELKGYETKSLTIGLVPLFLHLNTSLEARAHGQGADERLLRYHVAVGPSFTLPWQAATTIVADVYVDQSVSRHAADTVGLELGARYRVSPILAVHAGRHGGGWGRLSLRLVHPRRPRHRLHPTGLRGDKAMRGRKRQRASRNAAPTIPHAVAGTAGKGRSVRTRNLIRRFLAILGPGLIAGASGSYPRSGC
jgi:hypothetical protein